MKKQLIALIDCSSFYCSCERAFRADLDDKPICVLSNNDGCIISLTPSVKELGFKMGTPYYQVRKELEKMGVAVFSSNYNLYGDMSKRVVSIIRKYGDDVEQYSIDEAFLRVDIDEDNADTERDRMQKLAEDIHIAVLKGTGIPVRVSFGETKTLAKVGSEYTKMLLKQKKLPAVCFWKHTEIENFMRQLPAGDVWGIGRQWSKKLAAMSILSAQDLLEANPALIRMKFNVVMERTVQELKGHSCIPLELEPDARKSMVRSRMFAKKINDPSIIFQAVSSHLARGAEKLRKEKLLAGQLSVFITTGRHTEPIRYGFITVRLPRATNDTFILNNFAAQLFKQCYLKENRMGRAYQYSKAGVTFSDLISEDHATGSLFQLTPTEKPHIMKVMDTLNKRFGKYAIVPASMGVPDKLKGVDKGSKKSVEWGMRRELMSPRFTTEWSELLTVELK
jgi:DNA polymerase V